GTGSSCRRSAFASAGYLRCQVEVSPRPEHIGGGRAMLDPHKASLTRLQRRKSWRGYAGIHGRTFFGGRRRAG
ncbi:MAG: hypothetical protein J2P49_09430, partial [Methylocapsa sp.]|nr:hypothetical protein [Methylocapsa sp.]